VRIPAPLANGASMTACTYWSNFLKLRHYEVRFNSGPMDQDFSGSCTVTSRNSLIQKGATTATKSEVFRPKRGAPGLLWRGWRCVEESLATVNFREFLF